jgi:DNA uptake protein ComE-like DNA-binding protein
MLRRTLAIACWLSALIFTAVTAARVSAQATSAAATQGHDENADKALLETVCGTCHESSNVAGPFRTPAEWDEVIEKMQSYGTTAGPEQFAQIRAYLLRTYGKANVNTAAAKDLAPVLDIAPPVADGLVTYRQQNGSFKTLYDLKNVPGVVAA